MDKNTNLVNYLIKNGDEETSRAISLIKYELNCSLTYYGSHFKTPKESLERKYFGLTKATIKYLLINLYKRKRKNKQKNILSSAHGQWNNHFSDLGFNVYSPPWHISSKSRCNISIRLYLITKRIQKKLDNSQFNYLISKEFINLINEYYTVLKNECVLNSYDALILRSYNSFFEKVSTKIFRELGKPVIFWHHGGVPANYDTSHQDRADYFVLMGKKQVDHFIKMGYEKSKFLVSGHPFYNKVPSHLKFNLSNILVITKAPAGASPLESEIHDSRGNAIMYLYSIQRVLKSFGIQSARVRPHPSENYSWYKKMIDTSFYIMDNEELKNSLKNSTLVIGPISTVIIDSLYHGINYVLYEPIIDNGTILGNPITPPLDGKDKNFPTAHTEEMLMKIIKYKRRASKDLYGEFVETPRDISFLKDLI